MLCSKPAQISCAIGADAALSKAREQKDTEGLQRAKLVVTLKQHVKMLRWRLRADTAIEERQRRDKLAGRVAPVDAIAEFNARKKSEKFERWMTDTKA